VETRPSRPRSSPPRILPHRTLSYRKIPSKAKARTGRSSSGRKREGGRVILRSTSARSPSGSDAETAEGPLCSPNDSIVAMRGPSRRRGSSNRPDRVAEPGTPPWLAWQVPRQPSRLVRCDGLQRFPRARVPEACPTGGHVGALRPRSRSTRRGEGEAAGGVPQLRGRARSSSRGWQDPPRGQGSVRPVPWPGLLCWCSRSSGGSASPRIWPACSLLRPVARGRGHAAPELLSFLPGKGLGHALG